MLQAGKPEAFSPEHISLDPPHYNLEKGEEPKIIRVNMVNGALMLVDSPTSSNGSPQGNGMAFGDATLDLYVRLQALDHQFWLGMGGNFQA